MPILRVGQRVRLRATANEPEQEGRVVSLPVGGSFLVRCPPDAGEEGVHSIPVERVKAANARTPQIPKAAGLDHSECVFTFANRVVYYRANTSDLPCLREVIERDCYSRKTKGVTIESGDLWLDLGANIGAFSALVLARGGQVVAYEPEANNIALLRRNTDRIEKGASAATIVESCVTASHEPELTFYGPQNPNDFYRWNTRPTQRRAPIGVWRNTHISKVPLFNWDGIKMDIEGAEHDILDARALPKTRKLAMEYHATKDRSMNRFRHRMDYLRERFDVVAYPPALDRAKPGSEYEGFYDFIVHASGPKS